LNRELKYSLPLAGVILLGIVIRMLLPEPLDWKQSFSSEDHIPYGNKILYSLLPDIFPEKVLSKVRQPSAVYIEENDLYGENYVFVTSEFALSEADADWLLYFVQEGGNVFVAASQISGSLADSLQIKTEFIARFFPMDSNPDSVQLLMNVPGLHTDTSVFVVDKAMVEAGFTEFDSAYTEVLTRTQSGDITCIRIRYGEGQFLLCSTPLLFTNFHILQSQGALLIEQTLSCLPVENVNWDEYYKPGNRNRQAVSESPLRFIMSDQALKWAMYIALTGLAVFMIFGAKRKQRIIPVIPEPVNERLLFARTIGSLYLEYGNQKQAALKRIHYVEFYLRKNFHISSRITDRDFVDTVHWKTGIDKELLSRLEHVARGIYSNDIVGAVTMEILNTLLEELYDAAKQ